MAKRYSDAEKQQWARFVEVYNDEHGHGGNSAAALKFGVAPMTITNACRKFGKGSATIQTRSENGAPKRKYKKKRAASATPPFDPTDVKDTLHRLGEITDQLQPKIEERDRLTEEIEELEDEFFQLKAIL